MTFNEVIWRELMLHSLIPIEQNNEIKKPCVFRQVKHATLKTIMQHCYATHAQINCILSLISSKGIRLRHGMWSQGTSYEAELRKTLKQDIKRFIWNSTVFDKNLATCKLYIVKLHCIVIQTYIWTYIK